MMEEGAIPPTWHKMAGISIERGTRELLRTWYGRYKGKYWILDGQNMMSIFYRLTEDFYFDLYLGFRDLNAIVI